MFKLASGSATHPFNKEVYTFMAIRGSPRVSDAPKCYKMMTHSDSGTRRTFDDAGLGANIDPGSPAA
jgi:hypothetical protein